MNMAQVQEMQNHDVPWCGWKFKALALPSCEQIVLVEVRCDGLHILCRACYKRSRRGTSILGQWHSSSFQIYAHSLPLQWLGWAKMWTLSRSPNNLTLLKPKNGKDIPNTSLHSQHHTDSTYACTEWDFMLMLYLGIIIMLRYDCQLSAKGKKPFSRKFLYQLQKWRYGNVITRYLSSNAHFATCNRALSCTARQIQLSPSQISCKHVTCRHNWSTGLAWYEFACVAAQARLDVLLFVTFRPPAALHMLDFHVGLGRDHSFILTGHKDTSKQSIQSKHGLHTSINALPRPSCGVCTFTYTNSFWTTVDVRSAEFTTAFSNISSSTAKC